MFPSRHWVCIETECSPKQNLLWFSLWRIVSLSPLCCGASETKTNAPTKETRREIYLCSFWCWCDWLWCSRFLIRVRLAPCLNVYSALAEQLSQRPIMGYWSAPRARRKTFLSLCAYFSLRAAPLAERACSRFVLRPADGRVTPSAWRRIMTPVPKDAAPNQSHFLHPFHSVWMLRAAAVRPSTEN